MTDPHYPLGDNGENRPPARYVELQRALLTVNYWVDKFAKVKGENERLTAENADLKHTVKVLVDQIESTDDEGYPEWAFCQDGYARKGAALVQDHSRLTAELKHLRAALDDAYDEIGRLKEIELKQVRELHTLWKAIPIAIAHVRNHRWESALAELESLKGASDD